MLDDIDRKELFVMWRSESAMWMNENVRDYRMAKFGTITWCEERNTQCFGCLTEDGSCKHEQCLLDDPKHIEMRERQQQKTKKPKEPPRETSGASHVAEERAMEIFWESIKAMEKKAEFLYRVNEKQEADKLMRKSRRMRRRLWELNHGKEI